MILDLSQATKLWLKGHPQTLRGCNACWMESDDVKHGSDQHRGSASAPEAQLYLEAIFRTTRQSLIVLTRDLVVERVNRAFLQMFDVGVDETEGVKLYDLGNRQWDIPALRELLERILPNSTEITDFRVDHAFEQIGHRTMILNAFMMRRDGSNDRILLSIEDVTEREHARWELEGQKEYADKIVDASRDAILILDWDLRVKSANQTFYETFKVDQVNTEGRLVYELGNSQWDIPALRTLLEDVLPDNNAFDDFEVDHEFELIGRKNMVLNARRIDHMQLILLAIEDRTERRQREERQAFLLKLSDTLRSLGDPGAVLTQAIELLVQHLGLIGAAFYEVDDDQNKMLRLASVETVSLGWPDILRMSDFAPDISAAYTAGKIYAVSDAETDPRLSEEGRAAIRALAIRSLAGVPLVKDGNLIAVLHALEPREWRDEELRLVEEVVDRTWAAVERARAEAALRESESRLAAAFQSVPAGLAVIDAEGRVILANDEYRRFPPSGIIPSRDLSHTDRWKAWNEDGGPLPKNEWPGARALRGERVVPGQELLYTDDEGREFWTDVATAPTMDAAGNVTGCIYVISDITERKRVETALRDSEASLEVELRQTALLHKMAVRMTGEESVPALYEEILSTAIAIMGSDAGTVQVYDPETSSLVLLVTKGIPREMTDYFHRVDADSRTACGIALATGQRTFVDFDPNEADLACQMHVEAGIRSAQATPLLSRNGAPIGMLNTHWRSSGHRPSEVQLRFLDLLARQAADLIEQRRDEAALRESEERLRQFGDASQDVLWIRDAETLAWTYLTPAFEVIYGVSRDQALRGDTLDNWLELILPEDREHTRSMIDLVRSGEPAIFEYRIQRQSDGQIRWLRDTDFPIRGDNGKVVSIGGIGQDITSMKAAEVRLANSEERLRSAAEIARFALWDWNVQSGDMTWSDEHFRMQGYEVGEVRPSYEAWIARVHPDDRDDTQAAIAIARDTRTEYVHEFRTLHPDGSVHWLSARGRFFYDGGHPVRMIGAMLDTTERREWEERQKVLVAELQHRTRNLMGVVRSMADATARSSVDFPDFRASYRDRMAALARVQGLLSRLNEHDRVTFDELITTELTAMGAGSDRVKVEGPTGVRLRSSTVQILAIAIHELATNASKYGALVQPSGQLQVRWTFEPAGTSDKPWLHIDWRETGLTMPPADAPRGTGQGRELIEKALPYQLGAKTSYSFEPDGVHCTISIPVSTAVKEAEHA